MIDKVPYLYILVRTDIDSLNSGKMAAQACHAANAFIEQVRSNFEAFDWPQDDPLKDLLKIWQSSTEQAYGTTIVLDGGSIENIHGVVNEFQNIKAISTGVVLDPTYPVKDGDITHLVPLETCAWVFGDKNHKKIKKTLDGFELY